jgi:hypothetical protein
MTPEHLKRERDSVEVRSELAVERPALLPRRKLFEQLLL